MFTVPAPELRYEALLPGTAALEKPLTVAVGPVLTEDGLPITPVDLRTYRCVTYRRSAPGTEEEIWDDSAKQWQTTPALDITTNTAERFAYLADDPYPWQGIVVAAGGTDAFGQPQFTKGAGYPSYSFRGFFVSTEGDAFLSGPSANVSFVSVTDGNLMVIGPGEGEKPENATQARFDLCYPARNTIGGLVIDRAAPGAAITLSNAAGAAVVLNPDGSIEMRPAAGMGVRIAGDLQTEHITYVPAGGSAPQVLT